MSRLTEVFEMADWLVTENDCQISLRMLAVLGGSYSNPRQPTSMLWYLHRDDLRIIHRSLQSLQKERAGGGKLDPVFRRLWT